MGRNHPKPCNHIVLVSCWHQHGLELHSADFPPIFHRRIFWGNVSIFDIHRFLSLASQKWTLHCQCDYRFYAHRCWRSHWRKNTISFRYYRHRLQSISPGCRQYICIKSNKQCRVSDYFRPYPLYSCPRRHQHAAPVRFSMDTGLCRYIFPWFRGKPMDLGHGHQLLQNSLGRRRTADDHDTYRRRWHRIHQRIPCQNVYCHQHGRNWYPLCLRSNIIHAHSRTSCRRWSRESSTERASAAWASALLVLVPPLALPQPVWDLPRLQWRARQKRWPRQPQAWPDS